MQHDLDYRFFLLPANYKLFLLAAFYFPVTVWTLLLLIAPPHLRFLDSLFCLPALVSLLRPQPRKQADDNSFSSFPPCPFLVFRLRSPSLIKTLPFAARSSYIRVRGAPQPSEASPPQIPCFYIHYFCLVNYPFSILRLRYSVSSFFTPVLFLLAFSSCRRLFLPCSGSLSCVFFLLCWHARRLILGLRRPQHRHTSTSTRETARFSFFWSAILWKLAAARSQHRARVPATNLQQGVHQKSLDDTHTSWTDNNTDNAKINRDYRKEYRRRFSVRHRRWRPQSVMRHRGRTWPWELIRCPPFHYHPRD